MNVPLNLQFAQSENVGCLGKGEKSGEEVMSGDDTGVGDAPLYPAAAQVSSCSHELSKTWTRAGSLLGDA